MVNGKWLMGGEASHRFTQMSADVHHEEHEGHKAFTTANGRNCTRRARKGIALTTKSRRA
jgi:hypothetical protein